MKTKLTFMLFVLLIPSVLFSQEYSVIKDISYTDTPASEKQKLDIYIPDDPGLLPCLVWIHIGAWMFGSKDEFAKEVDTLLFHGYVVANIGYRLSSESILPAQIQDCKTAIRFLKENCAKYKIDSSRIAVAGASAGGQLAALVGTSSDIALLEGTAISKMNASSRVRAVVDFYGPTNFLIMDELPDNCENAMVHLSPDSPESLLLGCNIADCPEKVAKANPITYVTRDDPPFLIIHGTFDCTVTPESSVLLEKALKEKNVPVKLKLIAGAGHGGEQFLLPEVKALVLEFLDKNLK
jgi:acetyl esterase/lipase